MYYWLQLKSCRKDEADYASPGNSTHVSLATVRPVTFALAVGVPDLALGANRALRELGRTEWDVERYRRRVGNGVACFVKRALTGEMQTEPEPADRGIGGPTQSPTSAHP